MLATIPKFEDINIGSELAEHSQLLTIGIMQRWCSATETMRRDHFDEKYAVEHAGLPGALLSGSFSQAYIYQLLFNRSEARRVGNGCVSTCSSRWSPYH